MNELLTSLKINAEMTDEERKEIEKIYKDAEKIYKDAEERNQKANKMWSWFPKLKQVTKNMTNKEIMEILNLCCDIQDDVDSKKQRQDYDCDNDPPTFDDGIIYAYENVIKMLIEKMFE